MGSTLGWVQMSISTALEQAVPSGARRSAAGWVRARLTGPLQAMAFWASIVVPVCYLPVAILEFPYRTPVFGALLLLHASGLVLGRTYSPE